MKPFQLIKCRLQFSLRMLFIVLVVFSFFFAWIGYSLNWIRQRNAFLVAHPGAWVRGGVCDREEFPSSLWLFGEEEICFWDITALKPSEIEEVKLLFPEAQFTDVLP